MDFNWSQRNSSNLVPAIDIDKIDTWFSEKLFTIKTYRISTTTVSLSYSSNYGELWSQSLRRMNQNSPGLIYIGAVVLHVATTAMTLTAPQTYFSIVVFNSLHQRCTSNSSFFLYLLSLAGFLFFAWWVHAGNKLWCPFLFICYLCWSSTHCCCLLCRLPCKRSQRR